MMCGLIEVAANSKQVKFTMGTTESNATLSAFEQVKRIEERDIKTRSVNDLLKEYGI